MLPRKTDQIIREVHLRPVLWNSEHKDYQNKDAKDEAWIDVCKAVVDDFNSRTKSEKALITKAIRAKWRNVRDSYNRELRRNPKREPKYIHSDLLGFIKESFKRRKKPIPPAKCTVLKKPPKLLPITPQAAAQPEDSKTSYSEAESSSSSPSYDTDEDVAFFMSLMSTVKSLNEDQKLLFRMDVLQALNNIKRNSNIYPDNFNQIFTKSNGSFSNYFTSGLASSSFRNEKDVSSKLDVKLEDFSEVSDDSDSNANI